MSDSPPIIEDPIAIRRQYLSHETSVRSIGSLYYLSAFIGLLCSIALLLPNGPPVIIRYTVGPLILLLSIAYWKLGTWLRVLDTRGRMPATILACIGLLGFPIGTLISIYVLYLLNSKKAAVVFSPEYARVIEATPEIKYKTSKVIIVLLSILALFIVLGVIAAIFGKK